MLAREGGNAYWWRMRRVTLCVVLVAFVFSCGGQWPVLQAVAWANMIREYSEMVPLTQAIAMTFSGQYPCELCKIVAEKKESDNAKVATLFQHEKKLFFSGLRVAVPFPAIFSQDFVIPTQFLVTRAEVPPTPPPRFA
jgi:hypothetical protein